MVTIRDVSKHAGVGLGTVSRFVSGRGYVKRETGEKIRQSIQELGFAPNFHAMALRGAVGTSVGVVVPDISNALSSFVVKTLGDCRVAFKCGIRKSTKSMGLLETVQFPGVHCWPKRA
ncbi:LacI family DNA-binding transcriptional regulator [Roseinatronobacter alkalisoli]|uniref:LacI family DNA-binding transcriptional regulator n=1 Tax=Roseinatronobacter alkalisoli TaxID=3028235 RepID=UPI003B672109